MPSQCTKTCREADVGGRDPLWDAHQEIVRLTAERDEYARQRNAQCEHDADVIEKLEADNARLRALLVRYQAANYIPEDCDLYAETQAALEQRAATKEG